VVQAGPVGEGVGDVCGLAFGMGGEVVVEALGGRGEGGGGFRGQQPGHRDRRC
jgi:hypothetical protein